MQELPGCIRESTTTISNKTHWVQQGYSSDSVFNAVHPVAAIIEKFNYLLTKVFQFLEKSGRFISKSSENSGAGQIVLCSN